MPPKRRSTRNTAKSPAKKASPVKKASPTKRKAATTTTTAAKKVAKKSEIVSDTKAPLAAVKSAETIGPLKDLIVDDGWSKALAEEFKKPYFKKIEDFVNNAYATEIVYPPRHELFNAFNLTPIEKVKVVILGQDPYFNANQAMGLCFSVRKGVKVPPSLNRIYKVLNKTLGCQIPKHGDLSEWATRGVLMLNATLSVRGGKANSHKDAGWQKFTDSAIHIVSQQTKNTVYILWGGFAQKKSKFIDDNNNLILCHPHPSPMSGSAFNETSPFKEANDFLEKAGRGAIDWQITL